MTDHWFRVAACRGHDPNLWHPATHTHDPYREARLICQGCPVKQNCLDWAVDNEMVAGMWGGMSPRQRDKYRWTRGTPEQIAARAAISGKAS